jgi:hypothetical protein
MSKISTASKYICALLVAIASFHLLTHILLVLFSEKTMGVDQVTLNFSAFSGFLSHQMTASWQSIAQSLETEGFNSLIILSSIQLIPYLLIYFFLFKLFTLYQQGKVFTLANSHCFKNIARTLFAWIALNLFYPIVVTLFIRLTGLSSELAIYMSISSREFIYLLSGLIIYVMSWVMADACNLKKEQELVI